MSAPVADAPVVVVRRRSSCGRVIVRLRLQLREGEHRLFQQHGTHAVVLQGDELPALQPLGARRIGRPRREAHLKRRNVGQRQRLGQDGILQLRGTSHIRCRRCL